MHQNIVHKFCSCLENFTGTEILKRLKFLVKEIEGLTNLKEYVTEIILVQVRVV